MDLDKYGSKNTGSHTNIQENIGGAYKQIRTDGVYIRSHGWSIYTRRKIYEKVKIWGIYIQITKHIFGTN